MSTPTSAPDAHAPGATATIDLFLLDARVVFATRGASAWRFEAHVPGGAWPSGTVPVLTFEFAHSPNGPWMTLPGGAVTLGAEGTTDAIWLLGLFPFASARVSTIGAASVIAHVTGVGSAAAGHSNLGVAP